MTRSHHFSSTEVDELPAIHIAGNDGVTFKTCTAEVFRPVSIRKAEAFQKRDPQGLRRPRFSFFIFTCQTARDQEAPTFQSGRVPTPLPTMNDFQPTCVGCCVTQQGEEHQWRVRSPRSVTRRRRAQWSGYRPHPSALSTPIVNKSSHAKIHAAARKNPVVFRGLRGGRFSPERRFGEKIGKKVGSRGKKFGVPRGPRRVFRGRQGQASRKLATGKRPETFSGSHAVLEPQSHGVLV